MKFDEYDTDKDLNLWTEPTHFYKHIIPTIQVGIPIVIY